MIRFIRTFLISLLLFFPVAGICQIDVPKWVDDIGGASSNCISSAVGVDSQNNVYVTGFYNQTADFDPSAGVYDLTSIGGSFDTFVAKYTTDGKLIWAVSMGGSGTDQVNSLTVDASGNPTIIGQYDSPSFTVSAGGKTANLINNGGNDAFIVKLNTNGGLMWATSVGGGSTDYGSHVAADSKNNVIATVRYGGSVTVGNQTYSSLSGTFNGLIIKYDPNGNVLWAINLADPIDSEGGFDAVDRSDNILTCGHFGGNDNFNPLGTASYLNGNGSAIYVAKYNSSGNLVWVQPIIGNVIGNNANLCVNTDGDAYVVGPFSTPLSFNSQVINPTGSQDIFLAKYNSAGVFQSAGDIGGGSIFNYGIIANSDNYIYVSGYFSGTVDFDPSPTSVANVSYHGQQDFFLAKYDEDLNYKWAFNGGNADCSSNLGRNVIIDGNNNVLFTGGFCSTVNFSASTCSPYNVTAQSYSRDCFLAKYVQSAATLQAQITSFSVPQQTQAAVIDQTNLKITLTVPYGTDVSALVPTIVYSSGYTITPASGAPQDFTAPVTYTLSNGCTSLNYTVTVVYSSNVDTLCSGNSAKLTGNPVSPAPTSYQWQIQQNGSWVNAPGTSNAANYQTPVLTNNTASAVTYNYQRAVVAQGNTSYDSFNTILVLPATISNNTITAPAVTVFCASGDPSAITGSTPAGGTGTYIYQWQSSVDNVNFTPISGANAVSYDPPQLTSTTYYMRVVTSGQCVAPLNSNVVEIQVLPQPVTPVIPAQSVCGGSTATLAVSSPQSGVTYKWYDSASAANLLNTGPTYTTGTLSNNVTYYVEAINGQCTSPLVTVQVTVLPTPSAPAVTANKETICSGESITFTNNTPQASTNKWYTVPTGGTPIASGNQYITGPLTSGITYYIEDVSNNGCISATRTRVDIIVDPIPSAPQLPAPAPVCSGSSAQLQITSPQANLIYNWYDAATGGTLVNTGTQFTTPVLSNTTTYYVGATVDTGQCPSTRTPVQVTVNPTPAIPVMAATSVTVCSGSSASLAVTNPQAGVTYNWYDSAAKTNLVYSGITYVIPSAVNSAKYYIDAATATCTSITTATVQLNVVALPTAPVIANAPAQLCSGGGITLNIANPQTGLTYNWYGTATGGTSVFTGNSYPLSNLTANVSYYVEAVNSNSCASSRTEADITVNPLPAVPQVPAPAAICSGSSTAIPVSNPQTGITYNWYTAATAGTLLYTGTQYNTPALNSPVTYYVEADNSSSCASARTPVQVTVNPLPITPVAAAASVNICSGSGATLSISNPQTGVTYNWYGSAAKTNLLYTGTAYTITSVTQNATYYIEAVNGTCTNPSMAAVQVNVVAIPTAPVVTNAPAQICSGSGITLGISNAQTGLTYNWYSTASGGTPVFTGASYALTNLTASVSYYVEAVNSNSCSSTRTEADITVNPLPAAPQVPAPAAICSGSSTAIPVSNPQTGITYNWYTAATAGTLLYTGTQYNTPALTSSATYYIEADNNNGCASARTAVQITVNQLPVTPVATATSVTVCSGNVATLSVSSPQTGITYNWYDSSAKTNLLYTGTSYVTPALTANAAYYVEAVSATCTSPSLAAIQVNVDAIPAAPVVSNAPAKICSGSGITLNISNPQTGLTYNWYSTATGGTPVFTGSAYALTNLTAGVSYYIEAVNSNSCISSRTEADITVTPLPSAPQIPAPGAVCAGSSAVIPVSDPQTGITYNWYNTATGGTILYSGTQYTTPALTNSATYYAEAVNTGGCTSTTRTTVQVTVDQIPAVPVPAAANITICAGNTATLTLTNPQTGIIYNWYDSPAKTNLLITGTSYTTPVLNSTATYYIQALNNACTSPAMASVQVTVIALPAAPSVDDVNPTCANSQVTLNITAPQAGYTYNWYTSATGGTAIATGKTYLTPVLTASATYYADATNSNGCTSAIRTPVTVPISPIPDLTVTDASICPGSMATLTASSDDGTITWYANATGGNPLATGGSFTTPVLNNNATYYAEAVNSIGCQAPSRTAVTVSMLGQLDAPVVKAGKATSSSITFDWDAVAGATGYLVSIDNGVTYTAPSSGSDGLYTTITGLQENESITILVEATSAEPCQLSGSSTAVTALAHDFTNDIIYVANTFTPNGDGKNDVIYVHSENIKSMEFYVYDQWGELLFRSDNQSVGWDGTYKGVKKPVGVYVYFVKALMNDGQNITKKGTITLLR